MSYEFPIATKRPWPMRIGPILLREANSDEIEHLYILRSDSSVNRFMLRTDVDADTFRSEWLAVPTSEIDISCVVEMDGEIVAMGFLDIVNGLGQPNMPLRTEGVIGYIVEPKFWGQGIASNLVKGLLTAAFESLGLRRVTASCNADNVPSVRVLEKAGMRRERHGIANSWHEELGWIDGYEYAILSHEWRNSHRV